jgi:hypothetical protein
MEELRVMEMMHASLVLSLHETFPIIIFNAPKV